MKIDFAMTNKLSSKGIAMKVIAFILLPVLAAIIMGAVWGIVDWLRSYGSGLSPFPYFDNVHYQAEPFRRQTAGTLLGAIEDLNNWYNLNFRGATRFGSGLGWIFGAFVSMGLFSGSKLALRLLAGLTAGAAIGARSVLMLGSGAPLSLVGFIVGAVIGTLYMAFCEGPAKTESLPEQTLKTIEGDSFESP